MCVESGDHRTQAGVQCRAAVKAEPSEPDEHLTGCHQYQSLGAILRIPYRAQEYDRHVVRLVERLLPIVLSFAKNQGISQAGSAARDVYRATTSEVEAWKIEEPTVGVPGPICDGAVDDSSPKKAKDERRHDATTLERSTNDDHSRTGAEEEFVEAKDDLG